MEILFLHPNFPAQFKHLSKAFADNGHKTRFLCQTHYGRSIDGVERIKLENEAGHEELIKSGLSIFDKTQKLGKQYRQGLSFLKRQGYTPDIIISHSGFGCGLYVKEIWPKVRLISYLEWWFNPESSFFSYDQNNKYLGISRKSVTKSWKRNQNLALELVVSDEIVTPTQWQKNQLPDMLKEKCQVIFDGIDLDIFRFDERTEIRRNTLTYGTRGMDPMRCFPQLILALPEIFKNEPSLNIEIAGIDEANYGLSHKNGSWKKWAIDFLSSHGLESKVQWVGRLPPGKYERWLQSSGTHIYLSHPFVTSWSLVEAYCCFTPLLVSDIYLTQEICEKSNLISYADHREPSNLSEKLLAHVDKIRNHNHLRGNDQRYTARFGVEKSVEKWTHVSGVKLTTSH